jgi:hypothetical protein
MRNLTIQLSDELYQHARRSASNRNLTLSALVRNFFTTLDQTPAENQNDSDLFNQLFPNQPQMNMKFEYKRLAQAARAQRR